MTTPTEQTPVVRGGSGSFMSLGVLTSLFFMMGFITCLNDVLIPHLKNVFHLTNRESMLIQTAFFSAYAIMSYVVGKVIDRVGYKKTVVLGFLITAVGTFLFIPATALIPNTEQVSKVLYYVVFLPTFFIMATGIVFLQVAGNPYVTLLAPKGKESATLTLVQAFNSVATFFAPSVGGLLILADAGKILTAAQKAQSLQMPYFALTGILVLLAFAVAKIKLVAAEEIAQTETVENNDGRTSVFQYPHMRWGALAIFCYVGAEVAIGSQFILAMEHLSGGVINHSNGAYLLSFYWGGAMVGRFLGSYLLNKFLPNQILYNNAIVATVLLLLVALCGNWAHAHVAMVGMLAIGLFNSIMFPTIFSLATKNLGKFTADASGVICTAIVGGAIIPLIQGDVITRTNDNYLISFLVPAVCYLYIAFFAVVGSRVK